jgi:hypothetical protein
LWVLVMDLMKAIVELFKNSTLMNFGSLFNKLKSLKMQRFVRLKKFQIC